ncbi:MULTISPECIES: reverse transcriptase domain-containing protein [Lysinibacillus]|uniref:reverse transcriptase domain-containing protein n=1 Tax=Lysinibacillus TaxID=400634 RepID=UPI0021A53E83|nr:reverse transcriptase domain-containing protein [Lysinibacillus capsici]MCT1539730.1 reverse transcriptase [Lysinibacillus capsici]MCT1570800.1 reverse transcriptase [Lysinibacillus capsici]MCT1648203.1 reverse transcriptase [Lysinibacillus capsici]MCT1726745.1 reverse transcriptase [Lysinibacillus capsici]MCT1783870.1 reverse transcriptase [Lysinibacillus capsici]
MKDISYFENYKSKNYLHIDKRIPIKRVYKLIQDEKWVSKHAFLPFIHYSIDLKKYTFKEGHSNRSYKKLKLNKNFNQRHIKYKKPKKREINYASHIDSFIYKYYGDELNDTYNKYAIKNGIDENVLAYRNNKKGKNNIHFARDVFDFIIRTEKSLIIALDFSSFFDKISHKHLKTSIKELLHVDELSEDNYNVFKSITKFHYIEKSDLDNHLKSQYSEDELKDMLKYRKINSYMDLKVFRQLVKEKKLNIKANRNPYGIPQGSGMSAVCSNIRLTKFDIEMKCWSDKKNALYRRYCDDLIWIIPNVNDDEMASIVEEIYSIIEKYDDLHLQKEKTIILNYNGNKMLDLHGYDSKLDYLGFIFDGQVIKVREKSLFKFYNRAYKKTKVLAKYNLIYGRNAYMRNFYGLYSHLGRNYKGKGNFISYAYKAQKIMEELPVEVVIRKQVKRHWNKIHKRLEEYKKEYSN